MPFQLSPGVLVKEIDLTNVVPAVATSIGAVAGAFQKGPVGEITAIGSEQELVKVFGKPNGSNFETWFTAANFLQYGNALRVVRAQSAILNATSGGSVGDGGAKYNVGDIVYFQEADGQQYEVTAITNDALTIKQLDNPNGGGLKSALADGTDVRRRWRFYDLFDAAPGTSTYATGKGLVGDEMHVVVFDRTGDISGFRADTNGERTNSVLETFAFLSQAASAKTAQGGTNYYPDVIYNQSEFIYWLDHDASLTNAGSDPVAGTTFASTAGSGGVKDDNLAGGTDDYAVTVGELDLAYEEFADAETVDVNLIMAGTSLAGADGATHATNIIDLVEARKDCVAFISPRREDVVNIASSITQGANVKAFFDGLSSSSYAVFDSGYKYMYDKFNDVYRFVPLNGDMAGLCANVDTVADPFFSPGGFNRGQIRGAVKLAFNPTKAQRDILYPARINPVCTFPGQGTVLFGDKTALAKPSAFDRINVRRLFILLEKAIATAAKFQLFEFNDEFTQAQFRNLVEPFLRDIQGRRGITDFSVVCDGTNNTGEVIDRNEFVADIFIKPARSINFIQLNFIAVRTGVAFSEIGG